MGANALLSLGKCVALRSVTTSNKWAHYVTSIGYETWTRSLETSWGMVRCIMRQECHTSVFPITVSEDAMSDNELYVYLTHSVSFVNKYVVFDAITVQVRVDYAAP